MPIPDATRGILQSERPAVAGLRSSLSGRNDNPSKSLRRKILLRLARHPAFWVVVGVVLLLLMVSACIMTQSSGSGSSSTGYASTVPVPTKRRDVTPRVTGDWDELNATFSTMDIGAGNNGRFSTKEEEWRDRLIYYPYTRHDSWPIPDGNTTKNVLCYDAALTMCMALVLRDYTITNDSLYNEIVAAYGYERATLKGHAPSCAGGLRTMWPTTIIGYYKDTYNVQNNVIKNDDNALDLVKEALLKGHVVVAGDGRPMDFYRNAEAGDTYHCKNGHTIMFYKYENGTFWAKDWGTGPMVAYPETGGKIDLRDWMAQNSRGYIGLIEFYVEDVPQPKYPNIPDAP